ncbi:MAG: Asp-tRNA(Asn)/Glu-tRNA(Gln) amidotransferase GatCAB subunit B, partial [Candidatus Woesearchaeota archaeon]
MNEDIKIGLEIHIGLNTESKMFCGCPAQGEDIPNTNVCPVCLGHPGSKPVFNKKVLEYALKLCLALECEVAKSVLFSRKSYFYPDLSKNYQITQYEAPLGTKGKLKLKSGKEIRIARIHMEEDPASLVHPESIERSKYVLIDYNRSGTPLLEIVTEPDLSSPEEAREFMNKLVTILGYLEIFDIEKNVIKADINVSIKESNFTRAEIKNVTGFKEIENAIFYEVSR